MTVTSDTRLTTAPDADAGLCAVTNGILMMQDLILYWHSAIRGSCPYPRCMSILHVLVHAYVHVHVACQCPCSFFLSMSMFMLPIYVNTKCSCLRCMSMCMVHVHAHGTCPLGCIDFYPFFKIVFMHFLIGGVILRPKY